MIALLAAATCALTPAIHNGLRGQYDEAPVVAVLNQDGTIIEVWAGPDGATWTILTTDPVGVSCITGAGHGAVIFPPAKPGDPA